MELTGSPGVPFVKTADLCAFRHVQLDRATGQPGTTDSLPSRAVDPPRDVAADPAHPAAAALRQQTTYPFQSALESGIGTVRRGYDKINSAKSLSVRDLRIPMAKRNLAM